MPKIQAVYTAVNASVFAMCLVGIIIVLLWLKSVGKSGKYMLAILITHAVQILTNLFNLIHEGMPGRLFNIALKLSYFIRYATGATIAFLLIYYAMSCMRTTNKLKVWKYLVGILTTSYYILLVIAQFNHMYYWIDDNNICQRGDFREVSLYLGMLHIILATVMITVHMKDLDRMVHFSFSIYIGLVTIATVSQIYIKGITILIIANSAIITILFLIMTYNQTKLFYERERLLSEARMEVMLTQMQPHFLYNSLAVIDYLIKKDQDLARKGLISFSSYLRYNLNSLQKKELVVFSEEMKHIKEYLFLEKMRYDELLNIEYNINTDGFLLPPLSVQPLVENAVKHGLSDKPDGGTVRLEANEYDDRYEVVVSDDGIGFAPGEEKGEGPHVGIRNIRTRLANMCNGKLVILSAPGKGTDAKVTIYKD